MDPSIEPLAEAVLYALPTLVPMASIGMYYLIHDYVKPRLMARRGYIRIYFLTPSGKIRKVFVKPELEAAQETTDAATGTTTNSRGYSITVKKQKHLFVDNLDYIFQDGPLRSAFYDPEWQQMSISKFTKLANPLSGRIIDSLMTRVWNAARASIGEKKRNDTIMFLVIGLMAAAAAALSWQNLQSIAEMKAMITTILTKVGTIAH